MKIGIVGAGWYGCHIALELKKLGHDVTIFERNDEIFKGISGNRGIRLHAGPHYPRSEETRKMCRINFQKFLHTYPELVIQNRYSVYGLGDEDANFKASKVDRNQFDAVCQETAGYQKIDTDKWGYEHLLSAFNLEEPSIVGGKRLRAFFSRHLAEAGVNVICNFNVSKLVKRENGIDVTDEKTSTTFDFVINSTCFENLLPEKSLPFDVEVSYQPCLALLYKDKKETIAEPPFSFIVMDGLYPCIMPYNDRYDQTINNENEIPYRIYMVTHGKWTIMGSCQTFEQSEAVLRQLSDEFIQHQVKSKCEDAMGKFWPEFKDRFEYLSWTGSTLAKAKTEKEFRAAFTFAEVSRPVAHVFPGKVSCIFGVADEILKLINHKNLIVSGDYQLVREGVLHQALGEVTEKPRPEDNRNTCNLQTYFELARTNEISNVRGVETAPKTLVETIPPNRHGFWSPSCVSQSNHGPSNDISQKSQSNVPYY